MVCTIHFVNRFVKSASSFLAKNTNCITFKHLNAAFEYIIIRLVLKVAIRCERHLEFNVSF